MRDRGFPGSWSNTLTLRIRYQEIQTPSTVGDLDLDSIVCESSSSDRSLDECRMMRFSSSSLASLRSLQPTSLLVLLTPVLAPARIEKGIDKPFSTDPFEPFGRELSKVHQRLRHVPYVPKVGLTETHVAFIKHASAVVVVICEPTGESSESLCHQQALANAAIAARDVYRGGAKVPYVLVRFEAGDMDETDHDYENVVHAPSLTQQASQKATQLLFQDQT